MNEEVKFYLDACREAMEHAYEHLEFELTKIRAGKVTPDMLKGINVEYYGTATAINQLSSIKSLDARTLIITPFEKGVLPEIERAIFQANIGMTPQNDGELIRIIMPPTTEERRIELVKKAKALGEDAKVSVRNARKEANESIRSLSDEGLSEDMVKNGEIDVQAITDSYGKKIDILMDAKEKEVMTV